MFKDDTKTSPRRGLKPIDSPEAHLEDYPEIAVVIYKIYDCQVYHDYRGLFHAFEYTEDKQICVSKARAILVRPGGRLRACRSGE